MVDKPELLSSEKVPAAVSGSDDQSVSSIAEDETPAFEDTPDIDPMDPLLVRNAEGLANRCKRFSCPWSSSSSFPLHFSGTEYIFNKPFFSGWVVVSYIWGMDEDGNMCRLSSGMCL